MQFNTYHKRNFGSIECIVGPMFCGKTTELLRRARLSKIAKLNVRLYKPSIDTRYSVDSSVTHDNVQMGSQSVESAEDLLERVSGEWGQVHVVAIDEVQFVPGKIVEVCATLRDRGIRVIVAGLDMDFRREPFGDIGDLLAIADEVVKLKAVCKYCGDNAVFTKRLAGGQDVVQVGGAQDYTSVCERCYLEDLSPKKEV
jgi:thymidine kinase